MNISSTELNVFLDRYYPTDGLPSVDNLASAIFPVIPEYVTDPFDSRAPVNGLFVGCSWTQGGGMRPYPEFAGKRLGEHLDTECAVWNMGQGGCGNDYMARMISQFAHLLLPSYAFVTFSGISRREFFEPHGKIVQFSLVTADNVGHGRYKTSGDTRDQIAQMHEIVSGFEDSINLLKSYLLIERTLTRLQIPWGFSAVSGSIISDRIGQLVKMGWMCSKHYLGEPFQRLDTVSDDDSHPGQKSHEVYGAKIADWFHENFGHDIRGRIQKDKHDVC